MKTRLLTNVSILAIICLLIFPSIAGAVQYFSGVNGFILLQVEKNGEAWYVYPNNGERYYLGRPSDAFEIMKELSLGADHDFIVNTKIFPKKLAGMIILDVDDKGKAYYIYPRDLKKYYLGRPSDAFEIMQKLSLGITNQDLAHVPIGSLDNPISVLPDGEHLITAVPFTAQAPYGDWSDQREEDGCEEASSLMAVRWARGESLDKAQALKYITGSSNYTLDKYGEYRDISLQDTINWILKDYFGYDKVELKRDVTIDEMVSELNKGHLLLVPMNGQLLHNPHYTPPGPLRHMVVVRGYNSDRKVFITNDPGTKDGELYEYDFNVFYNAIRDYPTGYHELIDKVKKDMIVVWK